MTNNYDLGEMTKFLSLIWSAGARELRILFPGGAVWSGVYNDCAVMARHAAWVCANTSPAGVYFGLHCVGTAHIPQIAAGAANKVQKRPKHAVKAQHISHAGLVMVDIDSVHPPGVCATEAEKAEAGKVLQQVLQYMSSIGFPEPIVVDTGNGYHLYWLASCAPGHASWRYMLQWLAANFNTEDAKIDTAVYDAARIARLPGSINAKGTNTAERPHRLCKVLSYPDVLITPPPIYNVAKELGYTDAHDRQANFDRRREDGDFPELVIDEDGLIDLIGEYPDHMDLHRTAHKDGRTYFYLRSCPFHGGPHRDQLKGKTAIILSDETVGFKCFSDDCANHTFLEMMALVERESGHKSSIQIYEPVDRYETLHELYPIWGGVDDVAKLERRAERSIPSERDLAMVEEAMQIEAKGWELRMRMEDSEFRWDFESFEVERSGVLKIYPTDPTAWGLTLADLRPHYERVKREQGWEPTWVTKEINGMEYQHQIGAISDHILWAAQQLADNVIPGATYPRLDEALLEIGSFLGPERLWHIYRYKHRPIMEAVSEWVGGQPVYRMQNVNPLYVEVQNIISAFDAPPSTKTAPLSDLF